MGSTDGEALVAAKCVVDGTKGELTSETNAASGPDITAIFVSEQSDYWK